MDTRKEQIVSNLLWLLGTLTICSCSRGVSIDRHIEADGDSIKVACTLVRITPFEEDTSSFVHAEVTIANTSDRTIEINVRQLSLSIPDHKSDRPYYDGSVDILYKDEALPKGGSIKHRLYWAFKPPVSPEEIEQAVLTISPPF